MRPTQRQIARWERVRVLGCLACRVVHGPDADLPPALIHHCKIGTGLAQRNHERVAPLCPAHHQYGLVSRHGSPGAFAELYGTDEELHAKVRELLGEK